MLKVRSTTSKISITGKNDTIKTLILSLKKFNFPNTSIVFTGSIIFVIPLNNKVRIRIVFEISILTAFKLYCTLPSVLVLIENIQNPSKKVRKKIKPAN